MKIIITFSPELKMLAEQAYLEFKKYHENLIEWATEQEYLKHCNSIDSTNKFKFFKNIQKPTIAEFKASQIGQETVHSFLQVFNLQSTKWMRELEFLKHFDEYGSQLIFNVNFYNFLKSFKIPEHVDRRLKGLLCFEYDPNGQTEKIK